MQGERNNCTNSHCFPQLQMTFCSAAQTSSLHLEAQSENGTASSNITVNITAAATDQVPTTLKINGAKNVFYSIAFPTS